jgi:uncharacterized protein
MPAQVSYPGVYVQELPSGVRTIAGVATSRAAFLGAAPLGPIDKAVRVLGFADYERAFGGLAVGLELGYAVRQFFQNGGTDAYVVRVAKNATLAVASLNSAPSDSLPTPIAVLEVEALDAGSSGNRVDVRVDHYTSSPGSTFNLSFVRDGLAEVYGNLSMNSADARYVLTQVNGVSKFVSLRRAVTDFSAFAGTSQSGVLADVGPLLDETHNEFRVSVNGLAALKVVISPSTDISGATPLERLNTLCGAIESKVRAQANSQSEYALFTCRASGSTILMTSGVLGEFSSVRVLPGQRNNASAVLTLGSASGGMDRDGVAALRPAPCPASASLSSGAFGAADLDGVPSATLASFRISLDGNVSLPVSIGQTPAEGDDLEAKLADIAGRIQAEVRGLKPGNSAYERFTCTVSVTETETRLVLASGTRGAASSIAVTPAPSQDVAFALHLLAGASTMPGSNLTLQGGTETPYTDADQYGAFIGDRAKRQGIYALDDVDSFNLLCLPAVTDPGVLMDAAVYCEERRAFLIVDAPKLSVSPTDMLASVSGTDLPKSDHAAVYYPWIEIADPLRGGALRQSAPCGTIAGVYARTDATRGVWKAPAGTDATLVGVQALSHVLTDAENGTLNPLGVNCLRVLPAFGAVSWGARTLRGADDLSDEYKYVPVRRLALFLEESLFRGTQWVVFEPNDEPLWAQIRLNIGAFLHNLFRQGAFQGKSPREAYFVKCDRETTTQADIDLGIVNIIVGFAPLKPAEFVILSFQQIAPS